jgi:hypothetical protein
MKIRATRLSKGVWIAAAAHASAGSYAPQCPPSISEQSIQVTSVEPGWSAFVGAPLLLHAAAPMSGPPEQMGELSDYTQRRGKDGTTYAYKLDGSFASGKWLACKYGESDQVTLGMKLPMTPGPAPSPTAREQTLGK